VVPMMASKMRSVCDDAPGVAGCDRRRDVRGNA
jgi:hypothetical protein